VFGLSPNPAPGIAGAPLVLGAVGTVEPRKNLLAAAAIAVELHVIGRAGWGDDYDALSTMPHVKSHGFLPEAEAKRVMEGFDALICTSHDEGLESV